MSGKLRYENRRAAQTRQALIDGYGRLLLARRRGDIPIADIIAEADVGRSTFYDHFSGRDALQLDAMDAPMRVLAASAVGARPSADLVGILVHFWENRAAARKIFESRQRQAIALRLAGHIAEASGGRASGASARLIAEAALGMIRAWSAGEVSMKPGELAGMIAAVSAAAIDSGEQPD